MNFTREPIIETVITPRDGCKLVLRSSKGSNQEDYFVDAIEVVSFGHSFFFRSTERPKSFLLPMGDYEVLELKETRVALKNAGGERSIKIGGGREAPPRHQPLPPPPREPQPEEPYEEGREDEDIASPESSTDKRLGGRRRARRRRGGERMEQPPQQPRRDYPAQAQEEVLPPEGPTHGSERGEEPPPPLFISKLFPPPPTLIKETLSRYKPVEPEKSVPAAEEPSAETMFDHSDFDADIAPRDEEKKFEE